MAAIVVVNYEVTNPEAFEPYAAAAIATLQAHGAEVIMVDMNCDVIEGNAKPVTVILKFAAKAAMKAWYDSPEYQAVIGLRTDNTEGSMVVLETA